MPGGFKAQPVPGFIRKRKEQAKQSLRVLSTGIAKTEKKTKVDVGDIVGFTLSGRKKTGSIAFVGNTHFGEGDWCGIILEEPIGKNDGTVLGVKYFECKTNHGLFLPIGKVKFIKRRTQETDNLASSRESLSRSSSVLSVGSCKEESISSQSLSNNSCDISEKGNNHDMKTVVTEQITLNVAKGPLTVKIGEGTKDNDVGTNSGDGNEKNMVVYITGRQPKNVAESRELYKRSFSFSHSRESSKTEISKPQASNSSKGPRKSSNDEKNRRLPYYSKPLTRSSSVVIPQTPVEQDEFTQNISRLSSSQLDVRQHKIPEGKISRVTSAKKPTSKISSKELTSKKISSAKGGCFIGEENKNNDQTGRKFTTTASSFDSPKDNKLPQEGENVSCHTSSDWVMVSNGDESSGVMERKKEVIARDKFETVPEKAVSPDLSNYCNSYKASHQGLTGLHSTEELSETKPGPVSNLPPEIRVGSSCKQSVNKSYEDDLSIPLESRFLKQEARNTINFPAKAYLDRNVQTKPELVEEEDLPVTVDHGHESDPLSCSVVASNEKVVKDSLEHTAKDKDSNAEWPGKGNVQKRKALFDAMIQKNDDEAMLSRSLQCRELKNGFLKQRSKSCDWIDPPLSRTSSPYLSHSVSSLDSIDDLNLETTSPPLGKCRDVPVSKRKILSAKLRKGSIKDREHKHSFSENLVSSELKKSGSDLELNVVSDDLRSVASKDSSSMLLENLRGMEENIEFPVSQNEESTLPSPSAVKSKLGDTVLLRNEANCDVKNDLASESKSRTEGPDETAEVITLVNGKERIGVEDYLVMTDHCEQVAIQAKKEEFVETESKKEKTGQISTGIEKNEKRSAIPQKTGIPKIATRLPTLTSSQQEVKSKRSQKKTDGSVKDVSVTSKGEKSKKSTNDESTPSVSLEPNHNEPAISLSHRVGDMVAKLEKTKPGKSVNTAARIGRRKDRGKGPNEVAMGNRQGSPQAKSFQSNEELAAKEYLAQRYIDKQTGVKLAAISAPSQNGSLAHPKQKSKGKESQSGKASSSKSSPLAPEKIYRSASIASDTSSYVSINNQDKREEDDFSVHEKLKNQVNELRSTLRTKNRTLEALAFVIQHYAEMVIKEQNEKKALQKEKATMEEVLGSKDHELVEIAQQVESLQDKISTMQSRHSKDLDDLRNTMKAHHERHVDEVSSEYHEELEHLKESHEEEIQRITVSCAEKVGREKNELIEQHNKDMETVVSDYEEKLEELKIHISSISADRESLNQELNELRKKIEQKEQKEQKEPRSPYPVPEYDLPAELESLQAVLEIKKDEIKELRQQNMEMKKKVEDLHELQREHEKIVHEKEALEVALDNKSKFQRQISVERDNLAANLQEQSRKVARLSMENEELLWKVSETNLSSSTPSLNNNFSPTKLNGTPRSPTSPLPKKLKRLSLNLPTVQDEYPYS